MPKKYLIIVSAIIASYTLGVSLNEPTLAQDSVAIPPLGISFENSQSSELLDEESYEKIRTLSSRNHVTEEISITNIKVRSTIPALEIVSGKTAEANQELWAFLVTDERKIEPLGTTQSRPNKEYSLLFPEISNFKGQAYLISSLVSDLRLAAALPEKTSITPLYFSGEEERTAVQTDDKRTILINEVTFFENSNELNTLQTTTWEVYKKQESSPLSITISGQLYAPPEENLNLTTIILPTLEQQTHTFLEEKKGAFRIQLETSELSMNEPVQILIMASEDSGNMFESSSLSTHQVISFTLFPTEKYPTIGAMLIEALKNNSIAIAALLLFVSIVLVLITYRHQSRWAKFLSFLVLFAELGILSTMILINTANVWFEKGFLEIPGDEKVILNNSSPVKNDRSLTRLDENLEIVPGLSTSWSNISPHIWEFVLRNDVSTATISIGLQNKIQTGSPDRQYLASIKNIISVNPNKLQILTQYPDPLLPQKLSKVFFKKEGKGESTSELYRPLEEFTNSSRYEKNDSHYNLPFLKNPEHYQTLIRADNEESLKELIVNRSVDVVDEPETKLWPALLQNGYRIVPKINTESLVVMTDRKSFFLKDPQVIRALQIILKSPRILQSSYFQYGQLASQFAPPGVVGYDPELKVEQTDVDPRTLLQGIQQDGEITLTFQYPRQERIIATIIRQELERYGIRVIPTEIKNQDYEKALLQRTTDLNLIPLDFDIGDIGPFLDALIDSKSPFNKTYSNPKVDELVYASRTELNRVKRLKLLQELMTIIVHEDPAGIPLLFKRSFMAEKEQEPVSWWQAWLQKKVLGWE